jgi:hypothetical protein
LGQKAAVMPGVELTTSACDGHLAVAFCGELDVTGAADAEAAITALVAGGQYLVIDMSALGFLDCGALGALLRAQPLVRRLLALTGNDEVFWIAAGVEAAVAGIAGRWKRYPWRRLAVRAARPGRAAPSHTRIG